MAVANVKQQCKIINLKLETLDQHRAHLHDVVDARVNTVMSKGKAWLNNTGDNLSNTHDIRQMIENEITLLTQKAVEISDEDIVSSSSDTSSPLPSSPTAAVTETDPVSMKKVLDRLTAVEKAIVSLVATGNRVSDLENNLGEILAKQCEIDVRVEGVSEKQCEMDGKIEEMTANELEMRKSLKTMSEKQREVDGKILDVSGRINRMDEKLEKTSARLREMNQQVEDIASEYHETERKIGDISQLSSSAQGATAEISVVQAILSMKQKESKEMKELNERIKGVKRNAGEDLKRVGKKYEKMELQYRMVCRIIADRLLPLEKLRDILNQKIKNRDENNRRLNSLEQQVSHLSAKVSATRQAVGFTAYFPEVVSVEANSVVDSFRDVVADVGGYFDKYQGKFTAPVDGLYAASITLWQWQDGTVDACVIHTSSSTQHDHGKTVCLAATNCDSTSGTAVGIVAMKAGDTLCVKITKMIGPAHLSHGTSFSCFLIC